VESGPPRGLEKGGTIEEGALAWAEWGDRWKNRAGMGITNEEQGLYNPPGGKEGERDQKKRGGAHGRRLRETENGGQSVEGGRLSDGPGEKGARSWEGKGGSARGERSGGGKIRQGVP